MAENSKIEWTEREITVPISPDKQDEYGSHEAKIAARVLGDWAYHPLLDDGIWSGMGHCTVTHLPTGQRLPITVGSAADARRIVEALQGVDVQVYPASVLATDESRIAILERIIPIAEGMLLGRVAPGDTKVRHLVATVAAARKRLAAAPIASQVEE